AYAVEILDGAHQSLAPRYLGFPIQHRARERDIRAAARRVVARQGLEPDFRFRVHEGNDLLGELEHGAFVRIADVHGAGELVVRVHQPQEGVHRVAYVAERAGLASLAVHRDRAVGERLDDEIGD